MAMSKLTPGKEYERKFLVVVSRLPKSLLGASKRITQGYLALAPSQVRVRITDGKTAVLEIKGEDDDELGPYPLALGEAKHLLTKYATRVASLIEKRRHVIPSAWGELVWEIDFFEGDNDPLVIAEIETPTKGYPLDPKLMPDWIGPEVTDNPAFKNKNLAVKPYSAWPKPKRLAALKSMGKK
jgi:adenylate cyclase